MFSGIVTQTTPLLAVTDVVGKRILKVDLGALVMNVEIGDSVAINGTCLTVTDIVSSVVSFDVIPQTLQNTNLGALHQDDEVNVELSMKYGDPVGGHMVQGHVDQTVAILAIVETGDAWQVTFEQPAKLKFYLVDKGFVTLDGMSITIQSLMDTTFTVALIPHTRTVTISQYYQVGSQVNIEVDMMAKYVKKLIENIK